MKNYNKIKTVLLVAVAAIFFNTAVAQETKQNQTTIKDFV
jgi:hypothetical protein